MRCNYCGAEVKEGMEITVRDAERKYSREKVARTMVLERFFSLVRSRKENRRHR